MTRETADRIEKARGWATPVLLAVIAALLGLLGTVSIRSLDRLEQGIIGLREEMGVKFTALEGRVGRNEVCCAENRTRLQMNREARAAEPIQ